MAPMLLPFHEVVSPGEARLPVSERWVLYHFLGCPYCERVRRFVDERGIQVAMRDILREPAARRDLIQGGGRSTVPCLEIRRDDGSVEWLYESADIIDYLKTKLAA